MTRRFEFADELTPTGGTAISEWIRLSDLLADGRTVHEVRNVLACLIGIRSEGTFGWTPELRARDAAYERRLRAMLVGTWRRQPTWADATPELALMAC